MTLVLGEYHRISLKKVIVGFGNGLEPSGNKPLPEPMSTQIFKSNGHIIDVLFCWLKQAVEHVIAFGNHEFKAKRL